METREQELSFWHPGFENWIKTTRVNHQFNQTTPNRGSNTSFSPQNITESFFPFAQDFRLYSSTKYDHNALGIC